MKCTSDDDQSNSSEFGSGDEEVEYGLYTQLYFEPNPDITVANTTSKDLTKIQPKANVFQKTYQNVFERYLVDIAEKSKDELTEENNVKECQLNREKNNQNPTSQCFGSHDHTSTYTDLEKDSNCSPKTNSKTSDDTVHEKDSSCSSKTNPKTFDDTVLEIDSNCSPKTNSKTLDDTVLEIDSNCSPKTNSKTLDDTELEIDSNCSPKTNSKTSDISTSTRIGTNEEIREICVQKPDSNQCPSTSSDVCMASNEVYTLPVRREKLSNIYCVDSIPGSIPLDDLYCNAVLSDEEIQEDIGNKLAIIDMKALKEKNEDKTQNISRKRKRDGGTDSSDSEEESRCNSSVSRLSKNTRLAESTNFTWVCESDSESDVCVISQPSPKQPLIFTLDSNSDNELVLTEKNKKRSANETQVREDDSALPAKRTCTGKPESADERSESLKEPNRIAITEDNKKRNFGAGAKVYTNIKSDHLIFLDSDTESDSDSCLTKGTDLTLNVNEQLSVLIEKLTKDGSSDTSGHASVLNKKHNVPGVCHNVDFTVNQSETRKQLTCDSWTQERVDFYDYDLPESLTVGAVHKRQSDAKCDWKIIPADYQIMPKYQSKRGTRYFSQEDRCTLCRQYGHQRKDCDRTPHCHLCSGVDHTQRQYCPENRCFRCGGRTHVFCPDTASSVTCNLCGYQGHRSDLCPDLWRRFHLTTSGLKACLPLGPTIRPVMERFCYNCGQRGHYGHDCPTKYENRSYPQVPQSIFSYSTPVFLVNGSFVVNEEGAQTTNQDILKIPVEDEEIKYVIGRKGIIIREIKKRSGADVQIAQEEGCSLVCIYGSSEAQSAAKDMVEILLGRKPMAGYEDFFVNIATVNNQDLNLRTDGIGMSQYTFSKENDHIASSKWYLLFLKKLNKSAGNKSNFIEHLRKHMRFLNNFNGDVGKCIHRLKRCQTMLKRGSSVFSLIRDAKRDLKRIALLVIGQEKYGPGKYIHEHLENLIVSIQSSDMKIIPEEMCRDIAQTLGQVYEPSLEKLDELLEYASHYQLSCLESSKDTEERGITSKKRKAGKEWKTHNLKKRKKDQGGQGIISVPKNIMTAQREETNELQLGEAEEKVKLIIPKKNNPKKTGVKTKKKKKKKICTMCKRNNQEQCKKCIKQNPLKNNSPSIVHTHKQVWKRAKKKVKAYNLQEGKKDQDGQGIILKEKRNELQLGVAGKKLEQIVPQKGNHEETEGTKKKKKKKKRKNISTMYKVNNQQNTNYCIKQSPI